MSLKSRIAIILALVAASVWALYPRTTIERVQRDGEFVFDTVKRVPLKRGLDLRGGMHLSLEIDDSKAVITDKKDALERAIKVVRTRIDQFGVAEPVVQMGGTDRIIVELPGIDDPQRAIDVVQQSAFLEFKITDKTDALIRMLPRMDAAARSLQLSGPGTTATADSTPGALQGLFSQTPAADSTQADSTKAADTAATDSANLASGGPISSIIGRGQIPGEYVVASADAPLLERYFADSSVLAALPPGKQIIWSNDSISYQGTYRVFYVLDSRPILTGEYLIDARPNTSPLEGNVVEFTLNNEGGRRFRTATGKHVNDHMAIILDNQVMGQPPVINSAIGTRGQITVGGDLERAKDLALVLKAGALPVPLKVAEIRNIGPSLGQDSIDQSITAGLIAIGLILVMMVGYYRFSGLLAVGGLIAYVLYTLAALAGFDAVLTLPGLAGFVLSLGMAVDANVLIFERIREELLAGKSNRLAIDEGFKHALPAIIDSNVSSALTAAVLYQFGTGPVRGFAVTLIAGQISSMITAIFVVRTFYMIWLSRTSGQKALSI